MMTVILQYKEYSKQVQADPERQGGLRLFDPPPHFLEFKQNAQGPYRSP